MKSIEETAEKFNLDILTIEKYKLFDFFNAMIKSVNTEGFTWLNELGYRMSARTVEFFGDPYTDVPQEGLDYIDYCRNTEERDLVNILQNITKGYWFEKRTQLIKKNLGDNINNIENPEEPIKLLEIEADLNSIKKSYLGQSLGNEPDLDKKYSVKNLFKGFEFTLEKLKENSSNRKNDITELTVYMALKDTYVVEDTTNGKVKYMTEGLPPEEHFRKRKFSELDSVEELTHHFYNMFKQDQKTIEKHIRDTREFHYNGFHPFFPFRIRATVAHDVTSFRKKAQDTLEVADMAVIMAKRVEALTDPDQLKTNKKGFEGMKDKFYFTQKLNSKGEVVPQYSKETLLEIYNITGKQRFNRFDLDMIPSVNGKQFFEDPENPNLEEKIDSPLLHKYISSKTGLIHNSQCITNLRIKLKPGKEDYARNLKKKVMSIISKHELGKGSDTIFYNLVKNEDDKNELLIKNLPSDVTKEGESPEGSLLNNLKLRIEEIKEYSEWVGENSDNLSFENTEVLENSLIDYAKSYTLKAYSQIEKRAGSNDMWKGLVDVETKKQILY